MLGARELQFGQFLALVHPWLRTALVRRVLRNLPGLRIPLGMGFELRLTKAGEVACDRFIVVQAEMFGVGANKALVENATGELVEMFLFDGPQHAGTDFGDVGDVLERDAFLLALIAECVAELAHWDSGGVKWPRRLMESS